MPSIQENEARSRRLPTREMRAAESSVGRGSFTGGRVANEMASRIVEARSTENEPSAFNMSPEPHDTLNTPVRLRLHRGNP